jgi:hypothetical protein
MPVSVTHILHKMLNEGTYIDPAIPRPLTSLDMLTAPQHAWQPGQATERQHC